MSEEIVDTNVESTENLDTLENLDAIKYKIDSFEGPLDLLLHLVKEKKMDIVVKIHPYIAFDTYHT